MLNRVKLIKRTVEGAAPGEVDRFVWDSELAGFGLRVSPTGRKSFVAQCRIGGGRGGRQRRMTVGTYPALTVEKARERVKDILAKAQLGEDAAAERDKARVADTVADLVKLWQAEAAHINRRTGALRTPENVAREMGVVNAHILPLLGAKRLSDLKREDIERFRDRVTAGATAVRKKTKVRGVSKVRGGAGTATRTIITLSSILSFAVDRGLISANPKHGVRLAPGGKRERFMSPAELSRLGEALARAETREDKPTHPYGVAIIRLLALTGARRGEITKLRWSEVDFERGFLTLATSKTGRKVVLLPPAAVQVLEAVGRTSSGFVFPASRQRPPKVELGKPPPERAETPYAGLGKVWAEVRASAELEGLRLHDLRHGFASFGAAGGFGLPVIGALLGHKSPATTARYAHLADSPMRLAANRIGGEIASVMKMIFEA